MSKPTLSLIAKIAVVAALFGPALYLVFVKATVVSVLQGIAWVLLGLAAAAIWLKDDDKG